MSSGRSGNTISNEDVEPRERSSAQRECEPVLAPDGIRGGAARGLHHGRATFRHHLRQQRVGEAVRLEERGEGVTMLCG